MRNVQLTDTPRHRLFSLLQGPVRPMEADSHAEAEQGRKVAFAASVE